MILLAIPIYFAIGLAVGILFLVCNEIWWKDRDALFGATVMCFLYPIIMPMLIAAYTMRSAQYLIQRIVKDHE